MTEDDHIAPWARIVGVVPAEYPALDALLSGAGGDEHESGRWQSGEVPLRHKLNLARLERAANALLNLARLRAAAEGPDEDEDEEEESGEQYLELADQFMALDFDSVPDWVAANPLTDAGLLHDFLADAVADWELTANLDEYYTYGPPQQGVVFPRAVAVQLPETVGGLMEVLAKLPPETPLMGYTREIYLNAVRWDRWTRVTVCDDYDLTPREDEDTELTLEALAGGAERAPQSS